MRRAKKVITDDDTAGSGGAIVTAAAAAPPQHTETPLAPESVAELKTLIPTADIFNKFQSRSGDYEKNWLMLETNAPEELPPEKREEQARLREKLTRHLMASRGLGGASANSTTTAVSGSNDEAASEKNEKTATAASSASSAEQRKAKAATQENEEEGDKGSDDYEPEAVGAAQYAAATAETNTTHANASKPKELSAKEEKKGEVTSDEGESGMQGDFLRFLPQEAPSFTDAGGQALVMQARLDVSGGADDDGGVSSKTRPTGDGKDTKGEEGDAVLYDGKLNVPLWSERRFKQQLRQSQTTSNNNSNNNNKKGAGRSTQAPPAPFCGYYSCFSPTIALHKEITDFLEYIAPTRQELLARAYVFRRARAIVKSVWPQARVVVYGSYYTKLLLPLSDLDMTVVLDLATAGPGGTPLSQEDALRMLARAFEMDGNAGHLENILANASKDGEAGGGGNSKDPDRAAFPDLPPFISEPPTVIAKTRVPLVKIVTDLFNIGVDISFNATDGRRNTAAVRRLLAYYPPARHLIILFKYYLQQRGLQEPYTGGMGSYAISLLVFSFLQSHPTYVVGHDALTAANHTRRRSSATDAAFAAKLLSERRQHCGLGKYLIDFFQYVGEMWSNSRVALAVNDVPTPTPATATAAREEAASGDSAATPAPVVSFVQSNYKRAIPYDRNAHSFRGPRSPTAPPEVIIEDINNLSNSGSPTASPAGVSGGGGASTFPSTAAAATPPPLGNAASSLRLMHVISHLCLHSYLALTGTFTNVAGYGRPGSHSHSPHQQQPQQQHSRGTAAAATTSAGVNTNHSLDPAAVARSRAAVSVDSIDVSLRPTLLSRILHMDPETARRRADIERGYDSVIAARPALARTLERQIGLPHVAGGAASTMAASGYGYAGATAEAPKPLSPLLAHPPSSSSSSFGGGGGGSSAFTRGAGRQETEEERWEREDRIAELFDASSNSIGQAANDTADEQEEEEGQQQRRQEETRGGRSKKSSPNRSKTGSPRQGPLSPRRAFLTPQDDGGDVDGDSREFDKSALGRKRSRGGGGGDSGNDEAHSEGRSSASESGRGPRRRARRN